MDGLQCRPLECAVARCGVWWRRGMQGSMLRVVQSRTGQAHTRVRRDYCAVRFSGGGGLSRSCRFGHEHGSMYRPSATEQTRSRKRDLGFGLHDITRASQSTVPVTHSPSTSGMPKAYYAHHPGFNPGFQPRHPANITSPMHPFRRTRHEDRSRDRALSRYLRFETSMPRFPMGRMHGLAPHPPSA